ncbi:MAG: NUDIX domain-containing protein [Candidatus Andersenbacteria bacterium]
MTTDKRFVLQERDGNIPSIVLPGKICHFGKTLQEGEGFRTAAANAVRDEIGYPVEPDKLEFFCNIVKSTELYNDESDSVHAVYILWDVEPSELTLGQGAALHVWTSQEALSSDKLTRVTRDTLIDFITHHPEYDSGAYA